MFPPMVNGHMMTFKAQMLLPSQVPSSTYTQIYVKPHLVTVLT